MSNPVLIEVTRGDYIESRHRGAIAIVDADGAVALSIGDVDAPVFPRSSVKGLQALPLIESGAADRFGLTEAELALASSSHSGEKEHVRVARGMLEKCGLDSSALECGPQWPAGAAASRALGAGPPTALHNNCSGKHAGFVCVACQMGLDPAGYVRPDHAVQREVASALGEMTRTKLDASNRSVDGCAIPTYAIPLSALAGAFARFGAGIGLAPHRAAAARRLRASVAAQPFFVAGTDRFDTRVMEVLGARAFVKGGAEGVHCAAFPELGLGVAIKCDDGAGRAGETLMAAVIQRFVPLAEMERTALKAQFNPVLTNWNGDPVGKMRVSEALGWSPR
jgi:L-asparaginase II